MKLEDLSPQITPTLTPLSPAQSDQTIAQKIIGWVTRWISAGNSEPKIYHRRDRQGYSYLEVYDPVSGRTLIFNSAQEVRVWLERRYYE